VARDYFAPENRAVGLYHRKAGTAAEELPPEVAALPPEAQQMVKAQLQQLGQVSDAAQMEQIVAQLEGQRGEVPEPMKAAFEVVLKAALERLAELRGGAATGETQEQQEAQEEPREDGEQP
jgi:hypothetical protein